MIERKRANGQVLQKKRSNVVKVFITDRGGGCVNALKLVEEAWAILADACKGHLADLLLEDCAKPFKEHVKCVHELIIWIVSHDAPYGIFIEYDGVLALCIAAETRFATEVICLRSLQKDKAHVQKLFVDPKYEAWVAKQDPAMRAKVSYRTGPYLPWGPMNDGSCRYSA